MACLEKEVDLQAKLIFSKRMMKCLLKIKLTLLTLTTMPIKKMSVRLEAEGGQEVVRIKLIIRQVIKAVMKILKKQLNQSNQEVDHLEEKTTKRNLEVLVAVLVV